ncbi:toprim domain-containing protein [Hahella ganghwensis]|uniref:toprim domain-containing protein n=1 Tax=Hahella ganghwensis TaxID=286420 RepID=UPI000374F1EC|nr:toprim domain-containing protein [Hahella ganghwensis]
MKDFDNRTEIVEALTSDGQFAFKQVGEYLQQGRCPGCGKKELFVSKKEPWRVSCNRMNKCGYSETTRELYPELFNNYSERFPITEDNPNATADAYLAHNRRFPISKMAGCYEQGNYKLPKSQEWCNTVRFYLNSDRTLYWERLIDKQKDDGQRINFGGKRLNVNGKWVLADPVKGKWWMPPNQEILAGDRVYIVEGIFHALALHFSGFKAVAIFAAGYFPSEAIKSHLGKKVIWIVALDDDKAGRKFMRSHYQKLKKMDEHAEVALTGTSRDWDDLYRLGKITKSFLQDAQYRGLMFTAKSVLWKAYALYLWKRHSYFVIDFDNRLYSVTVDVHKLYEELDGEELQLGKGFDPFSQNCTAFPISNFVPELLYAERDDILDEKFYMFQVKYSSNNPDALIRLDGTNIDTASSFHKAMITKGYGAFSGSSKDMAMLHEQWLNRQVKEIQSIPYVGYHADSLTYVYQAFAFSKGKALELNTEGYFETDRGGIKTSFKGFEVHSGEFSPEWIDNFMTTFSWQGLTALAFWLGSLFVQQIRAKHKSFPFLELTGDPGAGKSTLIEFLWKLMGRDDYEGFDAMKATAAGRRRAFTQSSNMPLVLIESDRGDEPDAKKKQFDFDEFKPFFNGRAVGTLGVAKRGNDTEEPLFLGSLVFAQNAEVDGSEALLQRIVHCHCTTEHHTPGTRKLAQWFERQTVDQVAGFLCLALEKETQILNTFFSEYARYEEAFTHRGEIKTSLSRLVKNHAQVMAAAKALKHIFPTLNESAFAGLNDYLYERALSRQERLAKDHPLVAEFWESYEYLNIQPDHTALSPSSMAEVLNHSTGAEQIAINLNHFDEVCRDRGQKSLDLKTLKKLLPNSQRYKFVESRKVYSKRLNKTLHCWIFKR